MIIKWKEVLDNEKLLLLEDSIVKRIIEKFQK